MHNEPDPAPAAEPETLGEAWAACRSGSTWEFSATGVFERDAAMELPDINGLAVLRALRADYWTKPIDFRHFLDGIDRLLGPPGRAPVKT